MSQRKNRARRQAAAPQPTAPQPAALYTNLPPAQALRLPLAFALLLLLFALHPATRQHPALLWSFLGAGGSLIAACAALLVTARRANRTLSLEIVLRKQHYLQACAQLTVIVYWGWYWRQVYDSAYLIAAQLVFAYAFDMLLTWARRDRCILGFGPFPVIFSTNLFLWFKVDWFYWQFVMIAIGFAVKELVRWNKDGRRAHIFNPSSFPLALVSLVLLVTGTTDLTWGPEIAQTLILAPHMYLLIFAVSLPGQLLFGVAAMTLSAVATTYVLGMAYFAATGAYFFKDPSIPIAVFLGMHLLFTDPSTSPRTELGRIMFGVLYGLGVMALFGLLKQIGMPTHYDKLLAVPILNVLIKGIDALARSRPLRWLDPAAIGTTLAPRRRHLAYVAVWMVIFTIVQLRTGTYTALARADLLFVNGQTAAALAGYDEIVRHDPDNASAQGKLGFAIASAGRPADAVGPLRRAVELAPDKAGAYNNLGLALFQANRPDEAVDALQQALRLQPDYPEAHALLGQVYAQRGETSRAAVELREALRIRPDFSAALRDLALLLLTNPADEGRDPAEAVRLASRAADLTNWQDPVILDILAAAYAAEYRFAEAIRTAETALSLVPASATDLAAEIADHLRLYREGKPVPIP